MLVCMVWKRRAVAFGWGQGTVITISVFQPEAPVHTLLGHSAVSTDVSVECTWYRLVLLLVRLRSHDEKRRGGSSRAEVCGWYVGGISHSEEAINERLVFGDGTTRYCELCVEVQSCDSTHMMVCFVVVTLVESPSNLYQHHHLVTHSDNHTSNAGIY